MSLKYSRRNFLGMSSSRVTIPAVASPIGKATSKLIDSKPPLNVGTERQLFVDDYVIEYLDSALWLKLHHPEPQELAVVFDKLWEGSATGYVSIFKDDDVYRMYYGASRYNMKGTKSVDNSLPFFLCYAESKDGIRWQRPDLSHIEFQGSTKNNTIIDNRNVGEAFSFPAGIFIDDNPLARPNARYKAMVRNYSPKRAVGNGLLPMKSPDGIHWTPMAEDPVILDGEFDSQNLAFWDSVRKEYRAYWSCKINNVGQIRTAVSKDFIHWTNVTGLRYQVDTPVEELYTNVVKPYHRAPQLLIGFPARHVDRGDWPVIEGLPQHEDRKTRSASEHRFGNVITDSLLMSSRDGVQFHRWEEAFLRPGIERPATWKYGQQFITWSMVETASPVEGAPNELSLYVAEEAEGAIPNYSKANGLRRYTLRMDGFVSVNAPMSGGELVTRPMVFEGNSLELNFSTSAAGSIRIEIQDDKRTPISGFTLDDCPEIFGDSINRQISWKNGPNISKLKGKSIRLRFVMKDVDLYAFAFI